MRRTGPFVVAAAVLLLAAACTGGDDSDDTDEPAAGDGGASAATVTVPVVESVLTADGDAFGVGTAYLDVNGVASDGSTAVAIGRHAEEPGGAGIGGRLMVSTDGAAWTAVDLADTWDGRSSFEAVTAVTDGFVAVGNRGADGDPVAVVTDGTAVHAEVPLPFPEPAEVLHPYEVRAVAAVGDQLAAAATAVVGSADAPDEVAVRVAIVTSGDGGATWTLAEVPDDVAVVDTGPAVVEMAIGGTAPGSVRLAVHGGEFVGFTSSPHGTATGTPSVFRGDGEQWSRVATPADLFDGGAPQLFHSSGDDLLAFTAADGDVTAWRSTDDGATFDVVQDDPNVFGGDGRQEVTGATTTPDGALVLSGRTSGSTDSGTTSDPEVWVSPDLDTWDRLHDDAAFSGTGTHQATGVAALGDRVVVVGDQRRTIDDGTEAQHGAAWTVAFEEVTPPVSAQVVVEAIDVTGFDGAVGVNAMAALGDTLVAAGYVESDADRVPTAWTSPDGAAWTAVSLPTFENDGWQSVAALVPVGDEVLAVGSASADGEDVAGLWRTSDGVDWTLVDTRQVPGGAEAFHDLVETPGGLIAVGSVDVDDDGRFLTAGIWRSGDGGETWEAVPTDAAPFRQSSVESLGTVAVRPDGSVVAGGARGDGSSREDGGFSYTPQPFLVESADGITWTEAAGPFDGATTGDVGSVISRDAGVLATGVAMSTVPGPMGEVYEYYTALAVDADGSWTVSPQRSSHMPDLADAAVASFGTVLVGEVSRGPGGRDALIGIERDGSLDIPDPLIATGETSAEAVAVLGDTAVVLGTTGVDDGAPAVVGWRVTDTG